MADPRPAIAVVLLATVSGCLVEVPDVRGGGEEPGGPMVEVTAPDGTPYRIDVTEVTNAAYEEFLAAGGADPASTGVPGCAGDHDATPRDWPMSSKLAEHPVVHVDWCDARAFCAWAGKHLCAGIAGAPYGAADGADANVSEWYNACSAGGAREYPYGNEYVADRCNDASDEPASMPVPALRECQGGFPGLFGMSGNAREWDGCDNDTAASAPCLVRGGGFRSNPADEGGDLGCYSNFVAARDTADDVTGFRCCR